MTGWGFRAIFHVNPLGINVAGVRVALVLGVYVVLLYILYINVYMSKCLNVYKEIWGNSSVLRRR